MDTSYANIGKHIDKVTSDEGTVCWSEVLNDLSNEKEKKVVSALSLCGIESLSFLAQCIDQARESVKRRELADIERKLALLGLTNREKLGLLGSEFLALMNTSKPVEPPATIIDITPPAVNIEPVVSEKPVIDVEIETVMPVYEESIGGVGENGIAIEGKHQAYKSRYEPIKAKRNMKGKYTNYLLTKNFAGGDAFAIANQVLRYFADVRLGTIYTMRYSLKKGEVKPIHDNPILCFFQQPKPTAPVVEKAETAVKGTKTHKPKKTSEGFGMLQALKGMVPSRKEQLKAIDEYLPEDEIPEEVLAELDGQSKYL
ncbi:hypothetical protein [Photobacterium leiognathi]|uniref:hypothetical protein n=1 Tax=Photobacterium leiognathi TaxID=553611 RepID=UPI002980B114|nr:hypothetical protein [Photobacterium leiognathi]